MNARALIDKACLTVNVTCDHTYASAVIEALTAAGYRIVRTREAGAVTPAMREAADRARNAHLTLDPNDQIGALNAALDAAFSSRETGSGEMVQVAWMRDLDGTGSLHAASKGDPGAFPVYARTEDWDPSS